MSELTALFDRGARRYDLLVGADPGYHLHLRAAARRIGCWRRPQRILDLGCGSGASTRALLRELPDIDVLGVDASPGMISEARARLASEPRVRFVVGTAQELTAVLASELPAEGPRFDAVLAAYLLRNVPAAERDDVLTVIADHLEPGGVVAIQDYCAATGGWPRAVWNAVCWGVVIPLAALALGDTRLHRHLWRSGRMMEPPRMWCARLERAGLTVLETHHGIGWQRGILHTVIAQKAPRS